MIDGVGKPGTGRLELVRSSTGRGVSVDKAGSSSPSTPVAAPGNAVSEMASAGAPVDAGKVAAIRAAIAEGRYPVDPQRIADSMLALDLPLFDGQ